MVHLPNMSSLTVHGPLLPIGGKSGEPLRKKPKAVKRSQRVDSSSSDDDENQPLRRKEQLKAALVPSDDEDQPLQKPKGRSKAALVPSEEEDTPADSDEEEAKPLAGRKQKAEKSPTERVDPKRPKPLPEPIRKQKAEQSPTERVDPKRPKPLPEPEKVVDDAFIKAMADRVPDGSPDDVDRAYKNWRPRAVKPKHVPCCNGAKNDT